MAIEIKGQEEFEKFIKGNNLVVIHFMEDWAEQCKQMNEVLTELGNKLKNVAFGIVRAEQDAEISLKYSVISVPTFILYKNGSVSSRVEGANGALLTSKAEELANSFQGKSCTEDIETTLKRLINSHKLMLFMKGTPDGPRCGFSKTTIQMLNKYNADFKSFDILTDEEVRQGLKKYSNWPTYPQLYLDGELLGGLDILKEMDASGELEPMLPKK